MSHCTKFDFKYTSRKIICRTFQTLGLDWSDETLYDGVKLFGSIFIPVKNPTPAIISNRNGFYYFMVNRGTYYELLMEKHNMTPQEENVSAAMANEFKQTYIKEVAKEVVKQMNTNGEDAILEETKAGYEIRFGQTYDKSILIKFNNGRVIEKVQGVKGDSCVSLTEALEYMNGLTIYNMETY